MVNGLNPEKAKLAVRRGRKVAALAVRRSLGGRRMKLFSRLGVLVLIGLNEMKWLKKCM